MRTLFLGLMAGFLIYGLSFATKYVMDEPHATWWSIGLNLASIIFTLGWFLAVRRGFRLGAKGGPNRGERRAKEHARLEREKKQRMFR